MDPEGRGIVLSVWRKLSVKLICAFVFAYAECWLEAGNFGFRRKRNCSIGVAKTKALISFACTAKLICAFVFAYADCWFSHVAVQV